MKLSHLFLILVVVAVWGFNFVFIRIALNDLPPIFLCALRFTFAAIPAVFIFPRPKCSWKLLVSYGLVMFAFQFTFLFSSMSVGMPPGLASLLMQFQVFFTMFLAVILFKEKLSVWKVSGALISFSGILLVASHVDGAVNLLGLLFTMLGAFSWGLGNILSKRIGATSPLPLVVWGSLMAAPFLFGLSFLLEGSTKIQIGLNHVSGLTVLALAYIVYFSTHLAYSIWSFLLQKHQASTIAPFTLLVPVFGFIGSVVVLGETFPLWKFGAAILVILGLCVQFFGGRIAKNGSIFNP